MGYAKGLLILLVASAAAHATPILFNGTDISPMVDHFRKQVLTLDKSVTTYNWAPRGAGDSPERPQNDPSLLYAAQGEAQSFWDGYGSKEGSSNMYGYGLYTAADPVVTTDYGGGADNWRVLQIQFPPGTRILDLGNFAVIDTSDAKLTKAAEDVEEKFGCTKSEGPDPYFTDGGANLDPKCRDLVREVFQNILQIDAFAYGYNDTAFKECTSGSFSRAFVVTRPDWMRSEYAHFYTADSRLNEDERIRIQTLFMKAASDKALTNLQPLRDLIANYLDSHDDMDIQNSKTVCTGDSCLITVHFCDAAQSKCEDFPLLPALLRPGGPTITQQEADRSKLLWKDLIGKPKSTTISTWLRDNKFDCNGELPYEVKDQK